ncbi:MAG: DNA-3-methyladenine glycosylase 2 family protein [Planctomycetales bacterium]|nr:DNA-3-methyladenine glycosylase 2 family protein [Planctomycetales bacterium]
MPPCTPPDAAAWRRTLKKAERQLQASDSALAAWMVRCGKCQLEVAWHRSLFESLVRAVAHQQLHGKAAASILQRLVAEFPRSDFPSPRQLARVPAERLRGCGFSTAKVAAIQGIAAASVRGEVPSRSQAELLSDEELMTRLLPLRGVGRWTVEMILIFTLGRLDIMPVDDFGVRSGLQRLRTLPTLPKKSDFQQHTQGWTPYRSVAAWYLWRLADAQK